MASEWLIDALRAYEFRGKMRLLSWLAPKGGVRRACVHGAWMELDLSDIIQWQIYLGCVGRSEVAAVRRCLRPGGVMIDVGANVGYFTALGARCIGLTGRVFAVEPSPHAFKMLSEMVASNNLQGVILLQAGLGTENGEMTLYLPPESAHNHSPTMVPNGEWRPISVPVWALDDCLAEWSVDHVDLLKIDVEGYEPKVFAGAAKTLAAGRIGAILCEFNDYWLRADGSSPQALWQTLADVGFVDAEHPSRIPTFLAGCCVTRLLRYRG